MAVILVTVLSTVMTRGIGGTIAELPMSPAEVLLPMLPLFVLLGRLLGGGLASSSMPGCCADWPLPTRPKGASTMPISPRSGWRWGR